METAELVKILIVDDERLIRQGIKHYINWEQEGFQIVGEAANGREALEMIKAFRPDIVLTDIVMPLMDGEELTREIKSVYPEIEVVVLSSFSEFDYVRSSFQSGVADYILKPTLEVRSLLNVLRQTVEKAQSSRKHSPPAPPASASRPLDQIMERLIAGYTDYDEAMVREHFPHDRFILLGADLKRLSAEVRQAGDGWLRRMARMMAERLPDLRHHALMIEQKMAVMLLNLPSARLAEAERVIRRGVALAAEYEPELIVAQSEPFAAFAQVGAIFQDQLRKLLQYSFYLSDQPLMTFDTLPVPVPEAGTFDLNRFTDLFKRLQFESAFELLREHVTAMSASYTTDVFEYKSFLSNMIFTITVLAGNMKLNAGELEQAKYAYFNAIDQARDAGEAAAQLFRFLDEALRCFGALSGAGNAQMKRLLQYIEEHYDKPLSLKELARHFHFNPSYLSSYFTTHNKESFTEYLNRLRIAKASELLREDSAPISEIGSRVGYSDHSYFCRVFKKLTGQSPGQYRRLYGK